ncbi:MAG: CPBP family intramembrane glutamic endopeptidase [Pyrinomonadaceae bacterium]
MDNPPIQIPLGRPEELTREEPPSPARPDPDNPPWGLGGAVGVLFLSFLLMVVTQLLFLIPYALRRGVRLDALAEFALKDPSAIFIQVASIVPAHLLTLGLAWLLVTRGGKYPFFASLGWEWGNGFTFWRSTWLAVVMFLTGVSVIYITGPADNALERLLQSSRAAALATAFAATFTAPLVEEIVFRGLLYSSLRRLVGAAWAVVSVFVLFALIHVPQYWPSYGVIVVILMLSLALTLVRAYSGRLLPCFVVHLVFNAIQSVFIVIEPYLKPYFPETPTPDPGLLLELALRLCRVV